MPRSSSRGRFRALLPTKRLRSPGAEMTVTGSGNRRVYWGQGSAPSRRVLIGLAEKGLDFQSIQLDFANNEHKGPDVLKLNPRGQLPTFDDNGVVVNESIAALQYLEEAYPEPALLPQALPKRALVLQRTHEALNIQAAFRAIQAFKTNPASPEFKEKLAALRTELALWEAYLEQGDYLAGSSFSIADIAAAPFLLKIQWAGATLDGFPRLHKYLATLKGRKSIQATENALNHANPDTYFKGIL
ncbi:hypothetical protein WJX72_004567 [[Myrmecia] bisecta]|uniref:Glutathione S-transferase n=1 Tax=[Myrmecia] bisecta TaxID=41462 RepID=A0AAW1Q3V7_9CHLO